MGRMKFNIEGGAEAEANAGFASYSGPTPPKGTYKVRLKRMELVINSKDNPMFRILLEIAEKKGSKNAKYNGCGIWHNLNVTDQSKGYVNGFLDALAGPSQLAQKKLRKAFWETGIVTEGKGDLGHVLKIGSKSIGSPEGELMMAISAKQKPNYKDPSIMELEVASFLVVNADEDEDDEDEDDTGVDDDDEGDDEDDEDDEDGDEDDDEDSDDEDEGDEESDSDDGDDEGEDDEDSDDDEEEEPVKPAKKTTAKRGRTAF